MCIIKFSRLFIYILGKLLSSQVIIKINCRSLGSYIWKLNFRIYGHQFKFGKIKLLILRFKCTLIFLLLRNGSKRDNFCSEMIVPLKIVDLIINLQFYLAKIKQIYIQYIVQYQKSCICCYFWLLSMYIYFSNIKFSNTDKQSLKKNYSITSLK